MRLTLNRNLAPLRAAANAEIDDAAEAMRMRFLTPGSAQAMVYDQKRSEAELFIANPETAASELPHLLAEAEMNGITPFEQAVEYLTMRQAWLTVSPIIEIRRLDAKRAVAAAQTPAAIEDAKMVDWSDIEEIALSAKVAFARQMM